MQPYENLSLQDMEGEVWHDVVGYEGVYQVSNLGRLKSLEKKRKSNFSNAETLIYKERIRKQKPCNNGYLRVILSNNGRDIKQFVHRLVAQAFIDNPENKPTVNHINGKPNDNRIENLEWANHSEQAIHAYGLGLIRKRFGAEHWRSKGIIQKDINGFIVNTYECSLQLVDPFKRSSVGRAIESGKKYKGYYWESIV